MHHIRSSIGAVPWAKKPDPGNPIRGAGGRRAKRHAKHDEEQDGRSAVHYMDWYTILSDQLHTYH